MSTLAPVTLGQSWSVIYDATVSGDFVGGLNLIGGSYAVIRVASSTPLASDGGWQAIGSTAIELSKANGEKLYGKTYNGTSVVQLDSAQFPDAFPPGVFTGSRAMTVQFYTEANVKNGAQFEASTYNPALAALAVSDYIVSVGVKPVLLKGRAISVSGLGLKLEFFKNPTFTGGVQIPVFNLNSRNPMATTVQIIAAPTVTVTGAKVGCDKYALGSNPQGGSAVTSSTLFNEAAGLETLLAPNSAYLFRATSLDTDPQTVFSYNTWFEGEPDLPRLE